MSKAKKARGEKSSGRKFLEGLGWVVGGLVTAGAVLNEAQNQAENERRQRELEREKEEAKERLVAQMASNLGSSSTSILDQLFGGPSFSDRYALERLNEINKELKGSMSYWRKEALLEEKERLERKLGIS